MTGTLRTAALLAPAFLSAVAIAAAGGAGAAAAPRGRTDRADDSTLAADLARLRGETEQLAAALETEKEEARMALRGLLAQKTELELELRREEVRLAQLRERAAERRERAAADVAARDALRPAVAAAVGELAAVVRAGLPFHPTERAAQLEQLGAHLEDGLLTPHQAVARLWDRVEDELRLTRESGLYRQVVPVDCPPGRTCPEAEALVDVVRVGMVGLLFRAPDGRLGRADRTADGWGFPVFRDEADRARTAALFDAFGKQVRTGFFELPAATLPAAAFEEAP
jgi:hypothetical protein